MRRVNFGEGKCVESRGPGGHQADTRPPPGVPWCSRLVFPGAPGVFAWCPWCFGTRGTRKTPGAPGGNTRDTRRKHQGHQAGAPGRLVFAWCSPGVRLVPWSHPKVKISWTVDRKKNPESPNTYETILSRNKLGLIPLEMFSEKLEKHASRLCTIALMGKYPKILKITQLLTLFQK